MKRSRTFDAQQTPYERWRAFPRVPEQQDRYAPERRGNSEAFEGEGY